MGIKPRMISAGRTLASIDGLDEKDNALLTDMMQHAQKERHADVLIRKMQGIIAKIGRSQYELKQVLAQWDFLCRNGRLPTMQSKTDAELVEEYRLRYGDLD